MGHELPGKVHTENRTFQLRPGTRIVDADPRFSHMMSLALDPKSDYKTGVIRCILDRSDEDIRRRGYVDKSGLHKVHRNPSGTFTIGDPLLIANETEVIDGLIVKGQGDLEFLGLEDPDIVTDEEDGKTHLYFTIAFKKTSINNFVTSLGHAVGDDLDSLRMTDPVLETDAFRIKELSIAPQSPDGSGISKHLVESSHEDYSIIRIAKVDGKGRWELGDTVFHPIEHDIPWAGEHASPGPFLPSSFINLGNGRHVGLMNGRAKSTRNNNQIMYGEFTVGLFIYNSATNKIEAVSKEPLIQDPQARTVTFANQFIPTGPEEGIVIAHVDDSLVNAYPITPGMLTPLLSNMVPVADKKLEVKYDEPLPQVSVAVERNPNNPLLTPEQAGVRKIYNPAIVDGYMFYRAMGNDGISVIGRARKTETGYEPDRQFAFGPQSDIDKRGVEDPRITKIDGKYVMSHTAFDGRTARAALTESNDLNNWSKPRLMLPDWRHGIWNTPDGRPAILPGFDPTTWNQEQDGNWSKAAAVFPEKIGGNYTALFGEDKIYLTTSPDLHKWQASTEPVFSPRPGKFDSAYIEMGPAPMKIPDVGWLVIYNGVNSFGEDRTYAVGAALLDLDNPRKILWRSDEPILRPEGKEKEGQVDVATLSGGKTVYDATKDDFADQDQQPEVVFCNGAQIEKITKNGHLTNVTVELAYGYGDENIGGATAHFNFIS